MSERFIPAIGRSTVVQQQYIDHINAKKIIGDTSCDLCNSVERQDREQLYPRIGERVLALTNELFTVIENDFPYTAYDGQKVEAHHMIVPRDHIDFNMLKRDRKLRYMLADAEAEALELSGDAYTTMMSRTSNSEASSIKSHAHEHLLVNSVPIVQQKFSLLQGLNDVIFSGDKSL